MDQRVLVIRNIGRNKFRTLATILAIAIAIVAFVLLRTVISSWGGGDGDERSATDRLATRHRMGFLVDLPRRHVREIGNVDGVRHAMAASFFNGRHPVHEKEFFPTYAVDHEVFLDVYEEIDLPRAHADAWRQNRTGALVGRVLAKKFGWKVGDKIMLRGTRYPGDWEFTVEGIYDSKRRTIDLGGFYFHWAYLNDRVSARQRDHVGWVVARLKPGAQGDTVIRAIDDRFRGGDVQTRSMSERAMNNSMLEMFSAVLKAMGFVSLIILFIMALILGNTVAMGVRERVHEFGVSRAIGFLPHQLVGHVLGEAFVIGSLGGALGLVLSYFIVQRGIGRFLEENMSGFFPHFEISGWTAVAAIASAGLLSVIAAAVPAYKVSNLNVVDSLRRVG